MERTKKNFKDESGESAVEYGLLAALIALAIIGAVRSVGLNLSRIFDLVVTSMGS